MKRFVILAAAAALAIAGSAGAQTQTPTPRSSSQSTPPSQASSEKTSKSSTVDATFIRKAAEGGMAEVELGKLATEKAENDQVKKFGQRMVDDHSKANDELKSIASKQQVTLPEKLSARDQALANRLSKLSGRDFDRAYMQAMVSDHTADVNEFKKASTSVKDPDVKAFAEKTLPTLQDHLKMARDTEKEVAPASKTKTASPPAGH